MLTAREAYNLTNSEKMYKQTLNEILEKIDESIREFSCREHKQYSYKIFMAQVDRFILEPLSMKCLSSRIKDDLVNIFKDLGYYVTVDFCSLGDAIIKISWSKRDLARLEKAA